MLSFLRLDPKKTKRGLESPKVANVLNILSTQNICTYRTIGGGIHFQKYVIFVDLSLIWKISEYVIFSVLSMVQRNDIFGPRGD